MRSAEAWNIFEDDYPRRGEMREQILFALRYAMLAPSSHNSQPWLYRLRGDAVLLYADRARGLPVVDPEDRELILSCGASLYHLRLALRHFGYDCHLDLLPDPADRDLLARLRPDGTLSPSYEEECMFKAIVERHTNRMPFEQRALPSEMVAELVRAAREEGAWLTVIEDDTRKGNIATFVDEADRAQLSDATFRRELAAWSHPNRTRSRDGMPGYASGVGDPASLVGPLILRTFDTGHGKAARDRDLATGSPALALLGTNGDSPSDWLRAGLALDRVLLRARAEGIHASFLNQPIELPALRHRLVDEAGLASGFPQILLRLGYGVEVKPTPRRAVDEILLA